jgi:hypothetical protein
MKYNALNLPDKFLLLYLLYAGCAAKIHMYAKTKGNCGMENKYELHPPIDNLLCFGAVVLV